MACLCSSPNLDSPLLNHGEYTVLRKISSNLPISVPTISYISRDELQPLNPFYQENNPLESTANSASCRMDNCFDFSKCKQGFKIYVYPFQERISKTYRSILNIIKSSAYYTTDPKKACLFISGVDTLDQDKHSKDYVQNLQLLLHKLTYWNNGINHLIFNLYSGSWPDYSDKLGIDLGYAMLAKASASSQNIRTGFDISLPLFHSNLPVYVGEAGALQNIDIPSSSNHRYLLVFKGKRYLTDVGSAIRNELFHINNDSDVLMLTTCKHGKDWQKFADKRCTQDNEIYDK